MHALPSAPRDAFLLDPEVTFLNHGSFGACPRVVLEEQWRVQRELEREPVRFFMRTLEPRLDAVRARLAPYLGAAPEDLAFVPNATHAVSGVLRSLSFSPGDELLTTSHAYAACHNALSFVAERTGARVVVAEVPFPLRSKGEVLDAVLGAVTPRTKLAMLDHVTSPTALVLPIGELVAELRARGVETLVDGAHGVGLVPVDVEAIGAAYYTTNCHKWLCAPKGCAVLWVRRDRQAEVRPLSISHGARSPRADRSRFLLEHDWTGTYDPSAVLALPRAIEVLEASHPRGLEGRREANRALALEARALLATALGVEPPAPAEMLAAMVALPLPDGDAEGLYERLFTERSIEVPIVPFPAAPKRLVRVSAQVYSRLEDYERLARALPLELARERAA